MVTISLREVYETRACMPGLYVHLIAVRNMSGAFFLNRYFLREFRATFLYARKPLETEGEARRELREGMIDGTVAFN